MAIAVRDPSGTNYSPYTFDNPSLAQVGIIAAAQQAGARSHRCHSAALVTGYKTPGAADYAGAWPRQLDLEPGPGERAGGGEEHQRAHRARRSTQDTWQYRVRRQAVSRRWSSGMREREELAVPAPARHATCRRRCRSRPMPTAIRWPDCTPTPPRSIRRCRAAPTAFRPVRTCAFRARQSVRTFRTRRRCTPECDRRLPGASAGRSTARSTSAYRRGRLVGPVVLQQSDLHRSEGLDAGRRRQVVAPASPREAPRGNARRLSFIDSVDTCPLQYGGRPIRRAPHARRRDSQRAGLAARAAAALPRAGRRAVRRSITCWPAAPDDPRTILVGRGVDAQAIKVFQDARGHDPNSDELYALRKVWLDNEVLYREGLALGLDKGDAAIRDRVIFKALSMVDAGVKATGLRRGAAARLVRAATAARYDEPARFDFEEAVIAGDRSEAAVRAFVSRAQRRERPAKPRQGCACSPRGRTTTSCRATVPTSRPHWRRRPPGSGRRCAAAMDWRAMRLNRP